MATPALKNAQTYLAEFICSAAFGFIVYSAIYGVSFNGYGSTSGPVIVALAIGLGSVAIIYTFSDITVAHFNPAITLAAVITFKIGIFQGFFYILSQFLGVMLSAAIVIGCFPGGGENILETVRPKRTNDITSAGHVLVTELWLTAILVYVVFSLGINPYKSPVNAKNAYMYESGYDDEPLDRRNFAPIAIGLTLGFLSLLGLSSSGGAFNPAIVWAPMLFTGTWTDFWLYWVGEFVGGSLAGIGQVIMLYRFR